MEELIEQAFEDFSSVDEEELRSAVQSVIAGLDDGSLRVAEPAADGWTVNQWVKKAVLLSFRLNQNSVIETGHTRFYDKVPLKYAAYTAADFDRDGVRVVPDAAVRRGAVEPHGHAIKQSSIPLFALSQRFLRCLALGQLVLG